MTRLLILKKYYLLKWLPDLLMNSIFKVVQKDTFVQLVGLLKEWARISLHCGICSNLSFPWLGSAGKMKALNKVNVQFNLTTSICCHWVHMCTPSIDTDCFITFNPLSIHIEFNY